eukprot:GFYU01003806.1.p1 GENE.GFYU01003806.1~~GFYU01003806.1.p1  ORF type:complete len:275 (-),score=75.73 GFYU01003806.1:385-1209(-)
MTRSSTDTGTRYVCHDIMSLDGWTDGWDVCASCSSDVVGVQDGAWNYFGKATTDNNGVAELELPTQMSPGRYPLRLVAVGDNTVCEVAVLVVEKATDMIVFDIDGTLTTSNMEELKQILDKILRGKTYDPKVYDGAVDVVNAYAEKGYSVAYVTARCGILRQMSLDWLVEHGFPVGLTVFSKSWTESTSAKDYKEARFTTFVSAGASIDAGYGDADTDAQVSPLSMSMCVSACVCRWMDMFSAVCGVYGARVVRVSLCTYVDCECHVTNCGGRR